MSVVIESLFSISKFLQKLPLESSLQYPLTQFTVSHFDMCLLHLSLFVSYEKLRII